MGTISELRQSEPSLRMAGPLDIPTIWCLADEHKDSYLRDDEELTRSFVMELVNNGEVVVCHDGGLPFGMFWVADITDNLHGTIHFLCDPKRLKDILRHDIIAKFIDRAFVVYNVEKLKGLAVETQTTALKLLARHRFFRVGKLINETRVKGKPTNVVLFELQRHYWQKLRGNPNATKFDKPLGNRSSKRRIKVHRIPSATDDPKPAEPTRADVRPVDPADVNATAESNNGNAPAVTE